MSERTTDQSLSAALLPNEAQIQANEDQPGDVYGTGAQQQHGCSNSSDGPIVSSMELEEESGPAASSTLPNNPNSIDKLFSLIRLYLELYPKILLGVSALVVALLMYTSWQGRIVTKNSTRNPIRHDYTAIQNSFDFGSVPIEHWCLFGGNNRCYCQDSMEPQSREAVVPGWNQAHARNKDIAKAVGGAVDVVFLGDDNVQSWDSRWLDRPAPEGSKINSLFNRTFVGPDADFRGLALGIYGDWANNILWRIQHGELPASLKPRAVWLVMGTNDLAVGMCSEEFVTMGILRAAHEIRKRFPDAIVVLQGILPRSNHRDGSLEGKAGTRMRNKKRNDVVGNLEEGRAPQPSYDYYLWPSIQAINQQLEGFCAKHEHFVYFDAGNLLLGSIGNSNYRASHKVIIAELMPNYVHLSYLGHQVVMSKILDELKRIIYDDDERNDVEKVP